MSKRALVVEDDANIAELLRLYLSKDGFDVMIASDGNKAEADFDLFQPDVVMLDIMLPGKDGWEVCRSIRKKSTTPIIMLTAKGETNDKVTGLEMGADDYVTKPFWTPTSWWSTERRSIRRRRRWSFCITLPHPRTGSLPATSFWTRSGALTISEIRARSTFTSSA